MANRNLNFDFMRSISALAVVWLHVSANFVTTNPDVSNPIWWVGNIADSFSRWCVPVFVMLSGGLLLSAERTESPLAFYQKRLSRVLAPIFTWTFVYIIFRFFTEPYVNSENLIKGLIKGEPYFHMWYLYMLIGLYLFTPFFQTLVSALSRQSLLILILIVMGVAIIESMLETKSATFLSKFLPYVGYFLVGHYLTGSIRNIKISTLSYFAILLGIIIAIGTGLLLPKIGPRSWHIMYSNLNPLVVLMSISIFFIFLRRDINRTELVNFSIKIAPLSLGIYLIHPIFLWIFNRYVFWRFSEFPIISIPANTVVTFTFSAISVFIISKIPLLRRAV